jgi:DNA-binding PadR family transcriptional regulator
MTKIDQMRKGTTSMVILKLLNDADEPLHGYEIIKRLEAASEGYFRFQEGLIYPRMHQMEKDDLVTSHWQGEPSTRRRKVYAITEQGRAQLQTDMRRWENLSQAVDRLLGLGEIPA